MLEKLLVTTVGIIVVLALAVAAPQASAVETSQLLRLSSAVGELPVSPNMAANSFGMQSQDCNALKNKLKTLPSRDIGCIQKRQIKSSKGRSELERLRNQIKAASAPPPPDWCWAHRNEGVWHSRIQACSYFDNTLIVINPRTGAVTGGMTYIELDWVSVADGFPTYEQDVLLSPTSVAWGSATGTTVQGRPTCLGGGCKLLSSSSPASHSTTQRILLTVKVSSALRSQPAVAA